MMKKVYVSCKPEEKAQSYAAVVRRGGYPLDPGPVLAMLPPDIGEDAKSVILRESVAGADEVWVIGDDAPDANIQKLVDETKKPVRNILFESGAPAPAAPKHEFSVVLIYKDTARAGENFSKTFATNDQAVKFMGDMLEALAGGVKGSVFKVADDKKSGYIAIPGESGKKTQMVCMAYLLPIS